MFGRSLTVSGMKIEVSINGGIDIPMDQVAPVVVTCVMDGSKVVTVYADEGMEFVSEGGFLGYRYEPGIEITEICDRSEVAKQIKAKDEENDAMTVHTRGALDVV